MPMIEGRYDPALLSHENARAIFENIEDHLRIVIRKIRLGKNDCQVTVEGDPFGPISHGQPGLRIYVFYHPEWEFTPDELKMLASGLLTEVRWMLATRNLEVLTHVRFYARTGYAGATNAQDFQKST